MPNKHIAFTRENIYLRDKFKCQYCGNEFKKQYLTLDHVIPKSQGGKTTWENIVCSCAKCNHSKGNKTPEQANIKLIRKPIMPHIIYHIKNIDNNKWQPFIDGI
jgi:5-methylcytosine-specific restriction endonuclease McrA